jgi:Prenyltransferase and squalene oxidase repeat
VVRAAPPKKDKELEDVVNKALEFLKNNQSKDGSWSAGQSGGRNPAITALAVMAFLSAGHVPGEGPYAKTVEKGIEFVLGCQRDNGLIATEGHHEMYHHGICTLMLAEVAGMVKGKLAEEVRAALVKAVKLTIKAQRDAGTGADRGGWHYYSRQQAGSDMSCTGWQIMSLRAAKSLGCDVPSEVIDRAMEYVKRCRDARSSGFGYTPNGATSTPACTGTGILCLEVCRPGKDHVAEAVKAGAHLIKSPPQWGSGFFYYGIYYSAQASFQLDDQYWKPFREHLDKTLLSRQLNNGSWTGGGSDSSYGAPYCTAMSVLALTVEYRFLPIYQRHEESKDEK